MTDDELRVPDSAGDLRVLESELYNASRYLPDGSPAERAGYAQQAAQLRLIDRQRADERAPSLDVLGEKFGWSPAMLWHLAQPYCYCEIGHDGWQWCRHATDEGLDGLSHLTRW